MLVGKALKYSCKCGHYFEKYRNREDFSVPFACEKCQAPVDYNQSKVSAAKDYLVIGAKVQNAEYNPGLGQVVKSNRHKKDILKQKNLVEIGNDFGSGEKQQQDSEKKRKEERERIWSEEPKSGYQKFWS